MLFHLLHDLVHDEALQNRFQADPRGVLDEYQIGDEQRATLLKGPPKAVATLVHKDVMNLLVQLGDGGKFLYPWYAELIKLNAPTPITWNPEPMVGRSSSFVIRGKYFDGRTQVKFLGIPDIKPDVVIFTWVGNPGSACTLSGQMTFEHAGSYTLKVTNVGDGEEYSDTAPLVFTVLPRT